MVGKTHIAAGLAAGAAICLTNQLPLVPGAIFIAEAGLGSLLPDIDKRNSYINKVTKPIGFVTETVIGHRWLFHDLTFYLALGLLAWFFILEYMTHVTPVLLGVATHLILDALNPTGIPVLGVRVHLCNIHTGSSGDKFIGVMLRMVFQITAAAWVIQCLLSIFKGGM